MLKVSPQGDVASQLLDEGGVYLIHAETNERFTLDKNDLQLPLRKCALGFDSPVALSEEGQDVEVFPSTTNHLNVRATLIDPFQFPTLPSSPGAYAVPLDAETDLIAKIAGLDLLQKRISTQDFLTLFFGSNYGRELTIFCLVREKLTFWFTPFKVSLKRFETCTTLVLAISSYSTCRHLAKHRSLIQYLPSPLNLIWRRVSTHA